MLKRRDDSDSYLTHVSFKYHVSCTDEKISVRIIYFYYLFFHCRPIQCCVFFPVGLLTLMRHFQQVLLGVEVSSVSWLGQDVLVASIVQDIPVLENYHIMY